MKGCKDQMTLVYGAYCLDSFCITQPGFDSLVTTTGIDGSGRVEEGRDG